MYEMTTTFMSLTPAISLYYGFLGGFFSGIGTCGAVYVVNEARFISPDTTFYNAISTISNDPNIKKINLLSHKTSDFKLLSSTPGYIGLKHSLPSWIGPKNILVFNVYGKNNEKGIVSVVQSKSYFKPKINYLHVNLFNSNNELVNSLLLIDDHPSFVQYEDQIKSFLDGQNIK